MGPTVYVAWSARATDGSSPRGFPWRRDQPTFGPQTLGRCRPPKTAAILGGAATHGFHRSPETVQRSHLCVLKFHKSLELSHRFFGTPSPPPPRRHPNSAIYKLLPPAAFAHPSRDPSLMAPTAAMLLFWYQDGSLAPPTAVAPPPPSAAAPSPAPPRFRLHFPSWRRPPGPAAAASEEERKLQEALELCCWSP